MKDWISYIKDNLDSDIWGFLALDYYNYISDDDDDRIKCDKFISEVILNLPNESTILVDFHKIFLMVCIEKYGGKNVTNIIDKSIEFIKKFEDKILPDQINDIFEQYAIYGKKEKFEEKYNIYIKMKNTLNIETTTENATVKIKSKKKIKVMFLTALLVEKNEIHKRFKNCEQKQLKDTKLPYFISTYEAKNVEWNIYIARTGKGNSDASSVTTQLIAEIKPKFIFFIGIAGSLSDKIKEGHVIIPNEVIGFLKGKDDSDGFVRVNDVAQPSKPLLNTAEFLLEDEAFKEKYSEITIHLDEAIISTDHTSKVAKSVLKKIINKEYPNAKAVEMEGYGCINACSHYASIQKLLIRGISDKTFNKEESDLAGFQEKASKNAVDVAIEILKRINP